MSVSPQDQHGPDADGSTPLGVLLRLAADGELSEPQARQLEDALGAHADGDPRVRFEQGLRGAVGRVMGTGEAGQPMAAPAGLRERVTSSIAAQAAEDDAPASIPFTPASRQPAVRFPRFFGAVAAVLLLGVVGVFLATVVRTVGGAGEDPLAYRNQLAGFVSAEHARVTSNDAAGDRKWTVREPDRVASAFAGKLGSQPDVPNCDKIGIKFVGAGDCRLPGEGRSSHMQFELSREGDVEPTRVSIFVKPFKGELPLEQGVTYKISPEACDTGSAEMVTWVRDGLLYVLVVDRSCGLKPCSKLFEGLELPEPTAQF